MDLLEIIMIGVGLAMDAFAVSVCKGLSMKKMNWKSAFIIALYFGLFQALMPVAGYLLGGAFRELVESIDHWIAFILLFVIGANMIREAFGEEEKLNDRITFKEMLPLAVATSIDALTVGITFAFLKVNLILSVSIIGIITFVLCVLGVMAGNRFGSKIEKQAQILGGAILILIGLKILLEHLGII